MVQFVTLSGLSEYEDTVKLMEDKVASLINKSSKEVVYLVEYKDIYTAGTSFKANELLDPGDIPVIYTNRGGKFTYHGSGQRVIYPIVDLASEWGQKDLKLYIKLLEEWIINSLLYFGIKAFTINGMVGIWVKENGVPAKIASIGVRVRKWIAYHGIAVNISTNLDMFSGIIACGLRDVPVTSLKKLGVDITLKQFDEVIKDKFFEIFYG
ncbi:MAG: lipoyl(octanoyl) transferase LipB [Rickettsia endosymbiont of Culicoides impunctatus]|uniref:lipoyl(octanoyl) transferase LipB n=1 Tax=unclassified Candidatus Tisiphia TaxID=2996318 RepID=UPI001E7E37ED|nr:MAG: lipoyl(octanoyl) transferase LipB [Rickettsia endosymbiont of Culicoides impunctatus]